MHKNSQKLAINELGALSYAVVRRSPKPISIDLTKFVEDRLLENAKMLEKKDFRLLVHLIASVCKNDFGSDKFHRNFVTLDNLKKLARVESLDYISSHDILLLIQGLCKLTASKQ